MVSKAFLRHSYRNTRNSLNEIKTASSESLSNGPTPVRCSTGPALSVTLLRGLARRLVGGLLPHRLHERFEQRPWCPVFTAGFPGSSTVPGASGTK